MKTFNHTTHLFYAFALSVLFFSACSNDTTYVVIETEYGNMKAELYNSTPIHKENFIKLVKESFYDSLRRVPLDQ